MTALQKLGWRKVAALTQDGAKYSDYMSTLQDEFQNNNIEFIMNRKFPKEATDMRMVRFDKQASSVRYELFLVFARPERSRR